MQSKEDATNAIATLGHHNRVCNIHYRKWRFQDSLLEEFAAIDEPFLALTSLQLSSFQQQNVPVLPDSFLGGSAPRLRSFHLNGIPYPVIHHLESCFRLPLTLSGFPFVAFPILDILHPRRSSLVCPYCLGSSHMNLDSSTLDLRSIEQADIRPRLLVQSSPISPFQPKSFLFLQPTSIRHPTTWALHPSDGKIHDNPYGTRRIFQLGCQGHILGTTRRRDGSSSQASPTVKNILQAVGLAAFCSCAGLELVLVFPPNFEKPRDRSIS